MSANKIERSQLWPSLEITRLLAVRFFSNPHKHKLYILGSGRNTCFVRRPVVSWLPPYDLGGTRSHSGEIRAVRIFWLGAYIQKEKSLGCCNCSDYLDSSCVDSIRPSILGIMSW
ncbi:hypothetical protein [Microcoleus sp. FACHB-831]|uniref:hypothetical protein n=1 Tax=Microcoleus sp. FACHB-831 TaxID=2692827 RepID=UPI001686CAF6|nr:hypothetical protein [Microcoleus sp. FACHB-831]